MELIIVKKPMIIASSGGKDATLALHRIRNMPAYSELYLPVGMMTTFDATTMRSTAHNISLDILEEQAKSLGLPFHPLLLHQPASHGFHDYAQVVGDFYDEIKLKGIDHVMYGDIHLQDVKAYRDQLNEKHTITGVYPLWNIHPAGLIMEFLNLGYKAKLVAVNADKLGAEFLGRTLSTEFMQSLPLHIDPCAENGEFHTLVYDGPDFTFPISLESGVRTNDGQHHYQDMALKYDIIA
jgi:uncharacterized protein (TIGR00290 family)